jgi:hypothetical protein
MPQHPSINQRNTLVFFFLTLSIVTGENRLKEQHIEEIKSV